MSESVETVSTGSERGDVVQNNHSTMPRPLVLIILCLFLLVVLLSGIILGDTELSPDPQLSYSHSPPIETAVTEIQHS